MSTKLNWEENFWETNTWTNSTDTSHTIDQCLNFIIPWYDVLDKFKNGPEIHQKKGSRGAGWGRYWRSLSREKIRVPLGLLLFLCICLHALPPCSLSFVLFFLFSNYSVLLWLIKRTRRVITHHKDFVKKQTHG